MVIAVARSFRKLVQVDVVTGWVGVQSIPFYRYRLSSRNDMVTFLLKPRGTQNTNWSLPVSTVVASESGLDFPTHWALKENFSAGVMATL